MAVKDQSANSPKEPEEPKIRIYWAPSSKCSIGGFIPEDRAAQQPEQSLYFNNNVFSVGENVPWKHCPKDKDGRPLDENLSKVYQFIEASNPFRSGYIKLATSLKHAAIMTAALQQMKNVKNYDSSYVAKE